MTPIKSLHSCKLGESNWRKFMLLNVYKCIYQIDSNFILSFFYKLQEITPNRFDMHVKWIEKTLPDILNQLCKLSALQSV